MNPGRAPGARRRARAASSGTSRISFDYRPGPPGRTDVHQILPRIDTIPLTDLIDTFEVHAGMQPAGDAYGGVIPEFFRFHSATALFHGSSGLTSDQKTPVLACSCGVVGCWPLLARISLTGDLVVWDSFEQPFRTTRDYTAFGPFLFDRDQYDDAIDRLDVAVAARLREVATE
ncbi:hypothetical protein [Nocardia sp. AG03]|uniref:hypothetical protein n=1 Tax=Nocardia sp. AG03 TaxID=3025312 RepID=UPI00241876DF|nr:hypothetical protein [Nocardia sp. AG03]